MPTYIYERNDWPEFRWDAPSIADILADVRNRQGLFFGRMTSLGFKLTDEVVVEAFADEAQKSSEIEGETLRRDLVRSSIARKLGLDTASLPPPDRRVDAVVSMVLDAAQNFGSELTESRLFGWQAALFPTGYSSAHRIIVGNWRDDSEGPMMMISGPFDRELIHFRAPSAARVPSEMERFLAWFNSPSAYDPVIKAAVAHLWFVTIHPFDDGNGRIARAISDMALARSENSSQRFYSISAEIYKHRQSYYDVLEAVQAGNLNITDWIIWYLNCLKNALKTAEDACESVFAKARFWEGLSTISINTRQRQVLNRLVDGFEGSLTTAKWAKMTKCSHDTALRDIHDLIDKHILFVNDSGGRSTSYTLKI